jgi:hypothetical protein
MSMKPTDEIAATLTRHEWQIIMAGLGELPGKHMFDVAKKVEALVMQAASEDQAYSASSTAQS